MTTKTSTKAKANVGSRRQIVMTTSQVQDLIVGLYSLGCRILHARSPRMSVEMVRAVFERRLASEYPEAMVALQLYKAPQEGGR